MKTTMMVMAVAVAMWLGLAGAGLAAGGGGYPTEETTQAFTPPDSLWMLRSTKDLASYAKGLVYRADAYGGSYGVVVPGGTTYMQVEESNPDIRVILGKLAECQLSFEVAEPEVTHYFGVSLLDKDGRLIFCGSSSWSLSHGEDGWTIPSDPGPVELELAWEIPVKVPGATWAGMTIVDNNGNRYWENINVYNGVMMFPKTFAGLAANGWKGMLTVSGGNTGVVYDMTTGEKANTVEVNASVRATLAGWVFLDDPENIWDAPKSVDGQGESPCYQVTIDGSHNVALNGTTTEGEAFCAVSVRRAGSNESPTVYSVDPPPSVDTYRVLVLPMDSGVWDIRFIYPEFDKDQPVLPYSGGLGR